MLGTTSKHVTNQRWRHACHVPRGFIPLLVYAGAFALPPLLFDSGVTCFSTGWVWEASNKSVPIAMHDYVTYNYDSVNTQVAYISLAVAFSFILVIANDCRTWFNCVLFFHVGIEVKTIDVLLTYVRDPVTSTAHQALGISAVVAIVAHLVPFLVVSWRNTLLMLAFVGVQVNVATLVFLDPSRLLLVGMSSTMLLITTLSIRCVCHVNTSILSALVEAMYLGTWIVHTPYHLAADKQCGYVYHEVYHDSIGTKLAANVLSQCDDAASVQNGVEACEAATAVCTEPPRRYSTSADNGWSTSRGDDWSTRRGTAMNNPRNLRGGIRENYARSNNTALPRRSSSVPPLARYSQGGPIKYSNNASRGPRI